MFDLLIAILFGINNSARAKKKGQNSFLWIFITVVCVIIGEMIGGIAVLLFFNHGVVNLNALSAGGESMEEMTKQATALYNDPAHAIFVFLCGIGGYLLVRYILERMPDKKDGNQNLVNDINDPE